MAPRSLPVPPVAERPLAEVPEVPEEPQLLWPSIEWGVRSTPCDQARFPEGHEISARWSSMKQSPPQDARNTGNQYVFHLTAFADAVRNATKRVWVMDRFFADYGTPFLIELAEETSATDIRIVSKYVSGQDRRDIEQSGNRLRQIRNKQGVIRSPGTVEWKPSLDKDRYPFLHDRFAITDDELWHFGSTVGGGYPGLTAASRGWSAERRRAIAFFEEVWRQL